MFVPFLTRTKLQCNEIETTYYLKIKNSIFKNLHTPKKRKQRIENQIILRN